MPLYREYAFCFNKALPLLLIYQVCHFVQITQVLRTVNTQLVFMRTSLSFSYVCKCHKEAHCHSKDTLQTNDKIWKEGGRICYRLQGECRNRAGVFADPAVLQGAGLGHIQHAQCHLQCTPSVHVSHVKELMKK